ncbi:histidine kinase [Runella sp. MFBS21]|uniref:ATP-binding protein n=1 Tax=Runella sp. MFBS21 TaxID=3034018 RepID=UPI0023F771D2|nr:histidine kinase [Runella sp. MFBS21]MDF7816258.1 histidine kinase [Runella sp. MFBS21]
MNKTAIGAGTWGLILFVFISATAQPTPSILSVQANGKAKVVSAGSVVKLAALENDLHIEWKPCHCTYRYYTEGLDADTVILHYPIAHYTNLEGGEYRFWVQAQQNGQWSKPAYISLEIEESITEEGWFWPAVAVYGLLLAGAAIYFFLLYNFRQKLKLQSLRNRIAADLHDEVGATLSSIAISTRLVEKKYGRQAPEMLSILQQIKTDSEETIQTIRDTVWTLNPNNDSVEQLLEKMRSLAFQLLTPQDISLTFNNQLSSSETHRLQLSMEQRQNLYLIFKEALNNILKHAEASKVSVTFKMNGQEVLMNITDNGKGFDTTQRYEGNGLKNYKKRAAESFMEVTLISNEGEGTQLKIIVISV